jgi:hypothetical protein
MAYKLPRHPYLALVAGVPILALLFWSTAREFETGAVYLKRTHIYQSDNPIGFWLAFTLSVVATVGLAAGWCILLLRIARARRDRTSLPKRQE